MPANIIKAYSKKTGKSIEDVEKLWDKAISIAKEQGKRESDPNFYALVVGILKKILKMDEKYYVLSFEEFNNIQNIE